MLSIFSPKTFLRDLLVGFTDVHNHILPGIDDGAKTVEESIDLINGLNNLGFKEFIATPHTMNDYYPNTYETIKNAHNTVLQALTKNLSNIKHALLLKGFNIIKAEMIAIPYDKK